MKNPLSTSHIRRRRQLREPKDPQTPIWRYMDFAKFCAMLQYKSIFFTQMEDMEDQFEGTIPAMTFEAYRKEVWGGDFVESYKAYLRKARQYTFLSCWFEATYESNAMWYQYAKDQQGIAVVSRYENMKRLVDGRGFCGKVMYHDHWDLVMNLRDDKPLFLFKRQYFRQEQEIRFVLQEFPQTLRPPEPKGPGPFPTFEPVPDSPTQAIPVEVDLNTVLEGVYVAPRAEDWFVALVRDMLKTYGVHTVVARSIIDEEPIK